MNNYRITFSPNNLKPFTYIVKDFETASKFANILCDFDLGRKIPSTEGYVMINEYRKYRQHHSINNSNLIVMSTCTIDQRDDESNWWIISEKLDEPEYELGEMEAFDSDFIPDNENDLESICYWIKQQCTSGYGWSIHYEIFEDGFEMGDADYEHVANAVFEGYTSGELCISDQNEKESGGWWTLNIDK